MPITHDEKFTLTQHVEHIRPLQADPENGVSKFRAMMSRWYTAGVIAKPTAEEIAEADHHADGHEVEAADSGREVSTH